MFYIVGLTNVFDAAIDPTTVLDESAEDGDRTVALSQNSVLSGEFLPGIVMLVSRDQI